MQIKSIAECSFDLPFVIIIRSLFCHFLSDRFTQDLLYLVYASSEGSGESVHLHLHRLARAIVALQYDNNLIECVFHQRSINLLITLV